MIFRKKYLEIYVDSGSLNITAISQWQAKVSFAAFF
jgi:hypothetical protein